MSHRIVVPLIFVMLLPACASMGPKETAGTVIGGGTGAVIGGQFGKGSGRLVGVAIGTLAGALIGQEIGRSLDRADQIAMERNAQYSLEYSRTGQTTEWSNPDTGNHGAITPKATYKNPDGSYCREYQQTVWIAGQEQQAYGTACRQPDGTWKIVK